MGGIESAVGPMWSWVIALLIMIALTFAVVQLSPALGFLAQKLFGRADPVPVERPDANSIERLASDACRLRRDLVLLSPNAPFAKREAIELAYDDVLMTAASQLGVDQELTTARRGRERELERLRLEAELESAGFRLSA